MSICIRFMYGGLFQSVDDRVIYRKGSIFIKRDVDPDLLSKIEMEGYLEDELGMTNVKEFWYLEGGYTINNGLRQILMDKDITSMIGSAGRDKVVHVYVIQNGELSPAALKKPLVEGLQLRRSPRKKLEVRRNESTQFQVKEVQPNPNKAFVLQPTSSQQPIAISDLRRSPRKTKQPITIPDLRRSPRKAKQPITISDLRRSPRKAKQPIELLVQDEGAAVPSDSSSLGSDFSSKESEDEDDDIYDDNVEHSIQDDVGMGFALIDEPIFVEELVSEEDSENLISLSDSDGEEKVRYPEFNAKADFKRKIFLEAGMKFGSNEIFRRALRQHSIENGADFYYLHNDKNKVTVYCKKRCNCGMQYARKKCVCKMKLCGFKACARRVGKDGTFQLKTWEPKHDCDWQNENSKVSSIWLAEKYVEHHRDDPGWMMSAFINTVKRDYGVDINYTQAWRARFRAYLMTQGDSSAQYAKVWDYAATLIKWNRGSSAFVKVSLDSLEKPLFQRLYICLDACKKGFLSGCRPIIGLDGCHLKGAFTGQVLTAVAKDGNENMFPIAYAVVEAERKETWCWFLENLMQDLGDIPLTFMSDRQKGLLEALNLIVPMADTRVCVRHLHNNFKMKWPGKGFKDTLWAAARAFTTTDFQEEMENMKDLDKGAHAYLMKVNPSSWSRSSFKVYSKSDMLLNNVCESFNSYILQARDKPILTMCEWIRRALMKRFVSKRDGMMSYVGSITPKAKKRLEIARKEGHMNCRVHFGGGQDRFEVDHYGKTYVVDIHQRTCGCKKWDLTGIPCPHAVACILKERKTLEDFVDAYYSKETYLRVYSQVIHPMPGQQDWVQTNQRPPLPPMFIVQPGRPKKARRREEGEERPKKHKRSCGKYKCSHCGQEGHNKKKCNNPPKAQPLPKSSYHPGHNKGGRPKNANTVRVPTHSKRRITTQSRGQVERVGTSSAAQGQHEAEFNMHFSVQGLANPAEFNYNESYIETQASQWPGMSQTSWEGASRPHGSQ